MSYDRLAPAISSKAKGKLFGSGDMGQNNWVVVPLSDGLDTRPCKILDPRLNKLVPKTYLEDARHRARESRQ